VRLFDFERRGFRHIHWGVLGCMLALSAIGVITIAGSEQPSEPHAAKQVVWICIGLIAFGVSAAARPSALRSLAPFIYVACFVSLLLLPQFGLTVNNATSWYRVGPLRLQPSEFMKIAIVLLLSVLATRRPGAWESPWELALALALTVLPVLLIFRQPDFGTAAVFIPVVGVMLWMGGIRMNHLAVLGMLGLIGATVVGANLKPYQRDRIASLFSQEADVQGRDWNITQAVIALGSGQLGGRLLQEPEDHSEADLLLPPPDYTRASLTFLPEAHTDFIFASLGKHLGFIGCGAVIALYGLLALFALSIAASARTMQGGMLVIGLLTILLTHVVLNIGMCLRLLPVTGVPLPFLSYGGSSMLTNFLIGGLICHVGARRFEYDLTRI